MNKRECLLRSKLFIKTFVHGKEKDKTIHPTVSIVHYNRLICATDKPAAKTCGQPSINNYQMEKTTVSNVKAELSCCREAWVKGSAAGDPLPLSPTGHHTPWNL